MMTTQYNPRGDGDACAATPSQTPRDIDNRPGLPAIAYRAGTHAEFLANMLAKLSSPQFPSLAGLRTRDRDDFSIALLDAWATVADVLTFYQERIANENYLRTSTERRSLLELARLIGYELRPGVAASTRLAFTLEDAPGSPRRTTIAARAKVQSLPGPDEKPQTFETTEPLDARIEWNAIRPRQSELRLPRSGDNEVYLAGTSTQLKPGDRVVMLGHAREQDPGSDEWSVRRVQAVEPDFDAQRTCLTLQPDGALHKADKRPSAWPRILALRQRASLFGHNAPPWAALPVALRIGEISPQAKADGTHPFLPGPFANRAKSWADATLAPETDSLSLDAVYSQVVAGGWIVLVTTLPRTAEERIGLFRVRAVAEETHSDFNWTAKCTRLVIEGRNIERFSPRDTAVYVQSEELALAESPITDLVGGDRIELERVVPGLQPRQTLILRGKLARVRLADKADELPLMTPGGTAALLKRGELLTVLEPAQPSRDAPATKRWRLRAGPGVEGIVAAADVDLLPVPPPADDPLLSEIVTVERVLSEGPGHTTLQLTDRLSHYYDRRTVTLHGNIARATHGETVDEVVGSGDAGQPFQRFVLRQSPLTYVSASNPSGAESTLQLVIDDVAWHEVPTLHGQEPQARVFVSRADDAGRTTIQFGDGVTGRRPPTGQENVRATYRKGIGSGGLVRADQLSLLMTRPLGVKSVTNPLPATGAADRESVDDARVNAPLTVQTIERVVSLRDYEDFSRAFAGIAKALATWTWDGRERTVFVTVAGIAGAPVPEDSDLFRHLRDALAGAGDPHVRFRIRSYRPAQFRVVGSLRVAPGHVAEKVKASVDGALRARFSFAARSFGEPVAWSEVVAVIQSVAGVAMVDLDDLRRTTGEGPVQGRLLASLPREDRAAELLTLAAEYLHDIRVLP